LYPFDENTDALGEYPAYTVTYYEAEKYSWWGEAYDVTYDEA